MNGHAHPRYERYRDSGVEWLGRIPEGWEARRLKYLCRCNPEALPEDTDPEWVLRYVDIGNVDAAKGITATEEHAFVNSPSRARRLVRDGDVIISTVRTYLKAIAQIEQPPANLVVSTGFAVLRPAPDIDSRFMGYALQAPHFLDAVVSNSVGVSYPAINAAVLVGFRTVVPPLPEQSAIAAFLDRETARIDALIEKQERLIERLEEKRKALISRAVTQGLNPKVKMKDSGVEWLGKIPEHWAVKQNRWIFRERDERSTDGSEELLTVSHLTGVTPRSEKDVYMFLAESHEGCKRCQPRDLVINTMWAWMGALGISAHAGIVSPAYNVYAPVNHCEPRYFGYLYRTPAFIGEITRWSKGVWSSRLRLYPSEFLRIWAAVPPVDEQRAIVTYLDGELRRMDLVISRVGQLIVKLREKRTALISAVVTGKIDVREVA